MDTLTLKNLELSDGPPVEAGPGAGDSAPSNNPNEPRPEGGPLALGGVGEERAPPQQVTGGLTNQLRKPSPPRDDASGAPVTPVPQPAKKATPKVRESNRKSLWSQS